MTLETQGILKSMLPHWGDKYPGAQPVTLEYASPAYEETWELWFSWVWFFRRNRCTLSWTWKKNTFFSVPLTEVSHPIFVFKWTEPVGGYSGQHSWPRYPQELKTPHAEFLMFLQMFPGKTNYKKATKGLLQELQSSDYRMLAKKAQHCRSLPILAPRWREVRVHYHRIRLLPSFRFQLQKFLGTASGQQSLWKW